MKQYRSNSNWKYANKSGISSIINTSKRPASVIHPTSTEKCTRNEGNDSLKERALSLEGVKRSVFKKNEDLNNSSIYSPIYHKANLPEFSFEINSQFVTPVRSNWITRSFVTTQMVDAYRKCNEDTRDQNINNDKNRLFRENATIMREIDSKLSKPENSTAWIIKTDLTNNNDYAENQCKEETVNKATFGRRKTWKNKSSYQLFCDRENNSNKIIDYPQGNMDTDIDTLPEWKSQRISDYDSNFSHRSSKYAIINI